LEGLEKLEQLRALENGKHISVEIVKNGTYGVDTPQDLAGLSFS
jgi:CMP-2-keto-3-deoxyoctulosonic acid synthetase